MKTTTLVLIVGCALLLPTPLLAASPTDPGVGFTMTSDDFGNPCTTNLGDIPRIYDNATSSSVDVSVKVVNNGATDLVILPTSGFGIPPKGPQQRPRVMRVTLAPGASLGIQSQAGGNCGWIATVWPH